MIELTVREIAVITGGKLLSSDENALVKGFSIDSRAISPGEFFIAVKGENHDGHDFTEDAVARGASGIIAERGAGSGPDEGPDHVLTVKDSREAMGAIASAIRGRASIPFICITGTNGKTTLKDILSYLLSSKYRVLKSRKSYNNLIGLSLTLFELHPLHEIAVIEIGTNHPGEIRKLAEIARPSVCIITNIGDGHLEFFKDRKGVFAEKTGLLDFLTDSGTAWLNKDDDLLSGIEAPHGATRFFGASEGSDFRISDIRRKEGGYDFSLDGNAFFVPLEGKHNVYNAAAAVVVAEHFGVGKEEIRSRLRKVELPGMRLEKVEAGGVTFINDSYNANPASFECALKVLEESAAKGRKGVVAGGMMELGEKAAELHKMTGRSIAGKKIDFLITVGNMAEYIARGAMDSGMKKEDIFCAQSHEEAAGIIQRITGPGDVVLIKGSRTEKMEEVLRCFTTCYIR